MKKTYTQGFTLIELLVVIAIIGILSSVVLVSLNSARAKGVDAKIQSTLAGIRSAMEVYYSSNTNYGSDTSVSACNSGTFADAGVKPYIDSLSETVTGWVAAGNTATNYCVAKKDAYAVSVKLSTGKFSCVDSSGISRSDLSAINISSSDTSCN